ncbi:hypothetical protein CVV65_13545 [Kyrpidia spormannii]|uniref:Uncharacterized protein n=1 Tax=Kyrpidia spormannii TaxID=2055160 RepID=A0A2K8N949_9BACL|nr:hypothetical protein CVV65_13545 [Kyrpidia spormannii]
MSRGGVDGNAAILPVSCWRGVAMLPLSGAGKLEIGGDECDRDGPGRRFTGREWAGRWRAD